MAPELLLRERDIVRAQTGLYRYWVEKANGFDLPRRSDIDPVEIPHLIPNLSLIDADGGLSQMRYKVVGTRVSDIYGDEVGGKRVFDLDLGANASYWADVYGMVLRDRCPMQGAVIAPMRGRDHILLYWLRLPLRSDQGAGVSGIVAYDVGLPARLARGGVHAGEFAA